MSKKNNFYKPLLLNPRSKNNLGKINKFLKTANFIVDEIDNQISELFYIRHPKSIFRKVKKSELSNFRKSFYEQQDKKLFGTWVYYPWNNHLVHFLPESLHTEIRTSRNRNLITKKEQEKFYNASIAIAGLSVGNSSVANLLYSGGPKNMHLADYDHLAASNINRIRTTFINVGKKKTDLSAQEVYEVNPYSNLKLFRNGLNIKNLDNFLLKPRSVDVLIEEMDNLYLKVQIRLLARKHRIPVIMAADNGDNIIVDIERFDLEPNRPLLHGDVPEKELLAITPETPKIEAARIISRWVHPENVVPRMQGSLLEIGKSLYTWPQLGNAAFLAGCAMSYLARKIILEESLKSGKFNLSLDHVLNPEYQSKDFLLKKKKSTNEFKKVLNIP
ncbi:MAG: ThiF family adenylyltransferase [Patescibacteria group bacterium]|nr:ThiF family adenylyltransferase [Patescibacteria group bacterium]